MMPPPSSNGHFHGSKHSMTQSMHDYSSFDQVMDDLDQEYDFNNVNVDEKIFEGKLADIYLDLIYPIIEHCK